jgi:dTDP-4-amino-4,6-dideoxygalactose transaminase
LYVIRVQDRVGLMQHLARRRTSVPGSTIRFRCISRKPTKRRWGITAGDFPVSELVSAEIVSLPMFPGLLADQQERAANEIINFARVSIAVEKEIYAAG